MSKFKVGDKVKVLQGGYSHLQEGDIGIVTEVFYDDLAIEVKGKQQLHNWLKFSNVELVEKKNSKKERIKSLEKRIEELEKLIQDYFKLPIQNTIEDLDVIEFEGEKYRKVYREAREGDVVIFTENTYEYLQNNKPYRVHKGRRNLLVGDGVFLYLPLCGRSVKNTEVYELITSSKKHENKDLESEYHEKVKAEETPNQLRAEVIEKAKGFVDIKSHYLQDSTRCVGGFELKQKENPHHCVWVTEVDFVINADKRKVVALLKCLDGSLRVKGIANCNINDVFNEHIGKAIALGRALGLDVSEFEKAVQPTIAMEGTKVYLIDMGVTDEVNKATLEIANEDIRCGYAKIIDDTNTIYKEVE